VRYKQVLSRDDWLKRRSERDFYLQAVDRKSALTPNFDKKVL
jgi:hypothetical protein